MKIFLLRIIHRRDQREESGCRNGQSNLGLLGNLGRILNQDSGKMTRSAIFPKSRLASIKRQNSEGIFKEKNGRFISLSTFAAFKNLSNRVVSILTRES